MAELKIPQKTLQDNFNLQDFKDDFNALNSEIEKNKEIANTWETFKSSGGEIGGSVIAGNDSNESYLPFIAKRLNLDKKLMEIHFGVTNKGAGTLMRMVNGENGGRYDFDWQGFYPVDATDTNRALGLVDKPWGDIHLKGVSKSYNGYTKLPNGLIMQWGKYNQDIVPRGTHTTEITMPIRYPNGNLFSCANVNYNFTKGSDSHIEHINVSVNRVNSDKLKIKAMDVSNLDVETTFEVFWFSLGY